MRIDGVSRLVGLVGYPIEHTLSPMIHNAAFDSLRLNWVYVPLRVHPGSLGPALEGLRWLDFSGVNVTIPHKVETVRFMDDLREEARILEAVNTVVKEGRDLIGYNTDVRGFTDFTFKRGIGLASVSALLIGAGGAARAVALALARGGASKIAIANRTPGRAEVLRSMLKGATGHSEISVEEFDESGLRVIRECDLVINCTPLAVEDAEEIPIHYDDFGDGQWAVDLNYSRRRTAFLEEACKRGASGANGEDMLLFQAAASFRLWTGMEPPLDDMREVFIETIKGDR
ncbi:MAG: shikimate dehydrogenase [Actinomycetota bacterium]|nr:shikimate dehydrogenase [Actinomycetota bacterium]